jgi:ADP-heptose:LPS heptosyltransferase
VILISPWSRVTTDGKPSPKNYPHWGAVVAGLAKAGHEVVQVSVAGEPSVPGVSRRVDGLPFDALSGLIRSCRTWLSVDNFFHHFAWSLKRPGVVLFGMSDPEIFGHPENLNLLQDRRYLRKWQFRHWSQEPPNPEAFVSPEDVLRAVVLSASRH